MWWRLACVVVAAALAHAPASAQDAAAQFYKGKQITVIVGSSAGGGYDLYARLLSRHMPKHIPGNPAMVVTNMTGAGSNAAAAHLFNVAPRDGTVIGALQNSAVLDSLLDALLGDTRRLRHDATKFVHLGSVQTSAKRPG
jgi:tripartite-type tricarboxylate transporter receptor subunit TctC